MSRFIESLRLRDGSLENLPFHQARFERTRQEVLGTDVHPRLAEVIPIPEGLQEGTFKCRVTYGENVERIEFEPYTPRAVNTLKLVESDTVNYRYKYADRTQLQTLFRLRGKCDDILIVHNGYVTDSYTSNIVLWDGSRWYTPDVPLLRGTMREYLLRSGRVRERAITREDLGSYIRIRLINALNPLDEAPDIPVDQVVDTSLP